MKKVLFPILAIGVIVAFAFAGGDDIKTIKIGSKMPGADIKMNATDGKSYSFNDLKKKNGLLVIFSCNTCPFVVGGKDNEGWEGRYNEVYAMAADNEIGMVLVNSNEAKRDKGDSMEDMKKRAQEKQLQATYVLDEASAVADEFGARTTPHVFLFNAKGKLAYSGAIDDNVAKAADVKETWLLDALSRMGDGAKPDPAETRNKGCSIKRVSK